VHFVPGYFGFYMGKDPWHRSFNGRIRNYHIAFGPGAFKTTGFDAVRLARSDEQKKERASVADTMFITKHGEEKSHIISDFDPEELESQEEFSVSFYFRWGQRLPVYIRDPYYYLSQCFILTRLTEVYGNSGSLGNRKLGAWLCPYNRNPGVYYSTYDVEKGNPEVGTHIPMKFEDLDGVWNFFYFAWSKEAKSFVSYIKFGRSGDVHYKLVAGVSHYSPSGNLRFILGNDGFYRAAPGYFYAVVANTKKGGYIQEQADIEKFMG
jgi:hypothetical protein